MSKGNVVLGALAGLAIGAIAGILLAPEKGSTTRRKISKKGEDYADDMKNKFNEFIDSVKQKAKEAKEEGMDFVEKGKAKYDEVKKNVKNSASDFSQDGAANSKHSSL